MGITHSEDDLSGNIIITDEEELLKIRKLRKKIDKPPFQHFTPEQLEIFKKLFKCFGITKLKSFKDAYRIIDTHIGVSFNFMFIEKKRLKIGMNVFFDERPCVIEKFYWSGNVFIRFQDDKKPSSKIVAPSIINI